MIHVEHDSDDARIVAPTFGGFVFRMARRRRHRDVERRAGERALYSVSFELR